jgi:plasminogen activator inhibitor 1 RNA-binding protein
VATDGWDAVPIDNDPWSAPPPADPWGQPPEGDSILAAEDEKAGNDRKPERELEDEDSTISYDQYLAQLKETTTSSVPKLEGIREANEGADGAWNDVVEHKKNEDEDAYYVGKV